MIQGSILPEYNGKINRSRNSVPIHSIM